MELGIPVTACYFLSIPLWLCCFSIAIWTVLTFRIADKYIPRLAAPAIDRIYQHYARERASYPLPFRKHAIYRVNQDILGDFDTLSAGTAVRYTHSGHSIYDGYIGFFFVDADGKDRRWDIRDHEDPITESVGKRDKPRQGRTAETGESFS